MPIGACAPAHPSDSRDYVYDRKAAEARAGLSTCHISTPEGNPPETNQDSIQQPAKAVWAEGGSYFRISNPTGLHFKAHQPMEAIPEGDGGDYEPVTGAPGWGRKKRGKVGAFNRQMAKRLLGQVSKIAKPKLGALPTFVTLTYPNEWPEDPEVWKKHLERFRTRFERKWGKVPVFWRLELQKRGAPHFHALIFFTCDMSKHAHFKHWLSRVWYLCVGSGDYKHFKAGTKVERMRSWRGVVSYCAKYMAKEDENEKHMGRRWGVWWKDLLPIVMQEAVLLQAEFFRIRRAMVGYLKSKGYKRHPQSRHTGVEMYLNAADAARMVAWATDSGP